jgi:hypothetical protein
MPSSPITLESFATNKQYRPRWHIYYSTGMLGVGSYAESISPSVFRQIYIVLALGTGRLSLRRSKPVLRMRKPTADYVPRPDRFTCVY